MARTEVNISLFKRKNEINTLVKSIHLSLIEIGNLANRLETNKNDAKENSFIPWYQMHGAVLITMHCVVYLIPGNFCVGFQYGLRFLICRVQKSFFDC